MEKMLVRGVTKDTDVARISVTNIDNTPGIAFKLFSKLAQKGINVDIILQSVGRDGTKDITFTVAKDNAVDAIAAVHETFDIDDKTSLVPQTLQRSPLSVPVWSLTPEPLQRCSRHSMSTT